MNCHIGSKAAVAVLATLALFAWPVATNAQQPGTIQGVVTNAETLQPVAGAQVTVPGTQLGTLTTAQGRYLITGVPAGEHRVRIELIGFTTDEEPVTVEPGGVATANFTLHPTAIALAELVVTGVAQATPRTKLPFTVDKLTAEDMPVPAVSAQSAIQGRIAGARVVSMGQPGSGAAILLRGPTSINAAGRSQGPLLVVDGAIIAASMVDVESLDIESIEVVKGAAASTLYGSQAAAGVIQITTRRGRTMADGATRFTVRSEIGQSSLAGTYPLSVNHIFRMNAAGTEFVDEAGNVVEPHQAVPIADDPNEQFQDQAYPASLPRFNQVDRFFNPGQFVSSYVSAEGRFGRTNFHTSYGRLDEAGIIRGSDGLERHTFRLNVDTRLRDDLVLSASSYLTRQERDHVREGSGSPFFQLTYMSPIADLLAINPETGKLEHWVDRTTLEENPLYEVFYRQRLEKRNRLLGNASARYTPVPWFDIETGISYDRVDWNFRDHHPVGYATIDPQSVNHGRSYRDADFQDSFNAAITAGVRQSFGDLRTGLRGRYAFQTNTTEGLAAWGTHLSVQGIDRLQVTTEGRTTTSYRTLDRSEAFLLMGNLDWRDRYIADLSVRHDGSSLFGPDQRWHTYYRVSGAYRMSEEEWWPFPALNEFKLRASHGTAGNRPSFAAQYETYTVGNQGQLSPGTLGNRDLKPEHATENEFGLDLTAFDRMTAMLTYARSTIDDQLLLVPLPGVLGFSSQWRNAGELESNTVEATLEARLIERPDFSWTSRLLFDRTRQTMTRLDVPPYRWGVPGQDFDPFFNRPGEALGTIYGIQWATTCSDVSPNLPCDQFQVNDDGYLVWLGSGTFRDGQWGESGSLTYTNRLGDQVTETFAWGMPVRSVGPEGETDLRIGRTLPDFNISFSNNINFRGLQLFALLDAEFGADIYNMTKQWGYRDNKHGDIDQGGKPEDLKKPRAYYQRLYSARSFSDHFVEDGSYVKLRELAARYTFRGDALSRIGIGGVDRVTVGLIGRNLFTWSDYSGYDPEIGAAGSVGGGANHAAISRFDGFGYPNFRNFTANVEIVF
jgi:TonB-linked SusC/RagA family outer membrane protein